MGESNDRGRRYKVTGDHSEDHSRWLKGAQQKFPEVVGLTGVEFGQVSKLHVFIGLTCVC